MLAARLWPVSTGMKPCAATHGMSVSERAGGLAPLLSPSRLSSRRKTVAGPLTVMSSRKSALARLSLAIWMYS